MRIENNTMASCRLSLFTINLFIWSAFALLSCYVYGPTFITNFHTFLVFIEANTHLMLQYPSLYRIVYIICVSNNENCIGIRSQHSITN